MFAQGYMFVVIVVVQWKAGITCELGLNHLRCGGSATTKIIDVGEINETCYPQLPVDSKGEGRTRPGGEMLFSLLLIECKAAGTLYGRKLSPNPRCYPQKTRGYPQARCC